jgi:TPR repeat protein
MIFKLLKLFYKAFLSWFARLKTEFKERFSKKHSVILAIGVLLIILGIIVCAYKVNSHYTKISLRNIADNAYANKAYDIAVEYYKQLADLGEVDALIRLSDIYIAEDKGFTNKELAVEILKMLANDGEAEAQSRLGILYFESSQDKRTCIEHDYVKAFNWLSKATDSSQALKAISLMYKYGHGVEVNKAKSEEFFNKALEALKNKANDGNVEEQVRLGQYYSDGKYIEPNYDEAILWFEKAALQKNEQALMTLANIYQYGTDTVKVDINKANQYFSELKVIYENNIAKGHTSSLISLSDLYEQGLGVEKDEAKALELLVRAHEEGDYTAKELLMYRIMEGEQELDGITVESLQQDINDIKEKIALGGNVNMLKELAYSALNSERAIHTQTDDSSKNIAKDVITSNESDVIYVPNYEDAIHWFNLAAKSKDAQSMLELGRIYLTAINTKIKNVDVGVKWLEKSSELCFEPAYMALGNYYSGNEVDEVFGDDSNLLKTHVDFNKSIKWYLKAAMQGNYNAQHRLALLYGYKHPNNSDFNILRALEWTLVVKDSYIKREATSIEDYKEILELEKQYRRVLQENVQKSAEYSAKDIIQKYGNL